MPEPINIPATPTGLVVNPLTPFSVRLDWDDNLSPYADVYYVFRSDDGGDFVRVAIVATNFYVDTGLSPGIEYCYKLQACNKCGLSDETTSSICGTTDCFTPAVPVRSDR
jgi:hypothetical protein